MATIMIGVSVNADPQTIKLQIRLEVSLFAKNIFIVLY